MDLRRQLNTTYVAVVEGMDADQRKAFDRDLNETLEEQQRRAFDELMRDMGGPAGFNGPVAYNTAEGIRTTQ